MKTMMMLNQAVRYSHIIQILRRYGCIDPSVRILEVGSGSIGLGDYIKSRFIGCDIELRNISPYLLPVIGSSHQLPFKDSSFDVTTSSDMLEHLANENRLEAICELLRVSRRIVVIATPCGIESELCERKIASLYSRAHKKQPEWLTEHLVNGLPDEELISSILSANKKVLHFYSLNNENVRVHHIVMTLETIPEIAVILGVISRILSSSRICSSIFRLTDYGIPYRKIFVIKVA